MFTELSEQEGRLECKWSNMYMISPSHFNLQEHDHRLLIGCTTLKHNYTDNMDILEWNTLYIFYRAPWKIKNKHFKEHNIL